MQNANFNIKIHISKNRVLRVAMDGRRSDTFYLKNNVGIIDYTARTSLALRCKLSKSSLSLPLNQQTLSSTEGYSLKRRRIACKVAATRFPSNRIFA